MTIFLAIIGFLKGLVPSFLKPYLSAAVTTLAVVAFSMLLTFAAGEYTVINGVHVSVFKIPLVNIQGLRQTLVTTKIQLSQAQGQVVGLAQARKADAGKRQAEQIQSVASYDALESSCAARTKRAVSSALMIEKVTHVPEKGSSSPSPDDDFVSADELRVIYGQNAASGSAKPAAGVSP